MKGWHGSIHRLFITVHMGIKLFMVFFHNGWFFLFLVAICFLLLTTIHPYSGVFNRHINRLHVFAGE